MILSSVHLKNFRSHKDLKLNFSTELNYIVGGNGQGKTTVLESIYYLCTNKSLNSSSDQEVVRFSEDTFEVNGLLNGLTENNVRVYYSLYDSKKYYFRNGKQISRSADVIGKFPVVLLTPADHSITQGSPGDRRKFVDSIISQASETYLKILLDYNKTLRQRSSLLNQLKENRRRNIYDELEAWNIKMINSGSEIIKHRIKFIDEFNQYIKESYKFIMGENESPEIVYSFLDNCGREDIQLRFSELVNKKRDEEIRRATNLVGTHRDDFLFRINGLLLKTYGSQGQHKTFQVALRFAQFFYLKEITGQVPLFLLDDVFGELDTSRSVKISEYLRMVGQAFVTVTDFTNLSFLKKNGKDSLIMLKEGKVSYA